MASDAAAVAATAMPASVLTDPRLSKCARTEGGSISTATTEAAVMPCHEPASVHSISAPPAPRDSSGLGETPSRLDATTSVETIVLLSDDEDADSVIGRPGTGPKVGRGSSGKKRGRGGSPSAPKAVKVVSKAAQRRADKESAVERAGYEAAYAAAMRSSLSVKLPPVPPGTVRRQLKYPTEDNLREWSHHCGCSTVADPILAACGAGLVSFTFGLEVVGKDPAEFAPPPAAARAPATAGGGFRAHSSSTNLSSSSTAPCRPAQTQSSSATAAGSSAGSKRLGGPMRLQSSLSSGGSSLSRPGGSSLSRRPTGFKAPIPHAPSTNVGGRVKSGAKSGAAAARNGGGAKTAKALSRRKESESEGASDADSGEGSGEEESEREDSDSAQESEVENGIVA